MKLVNVFVVCSVLAISPSIFGHNTLKEVAQASKACNFVGSNKVNLPYRLIEPNVKNGKKYPLVVFLHGAGERGTNNVAQLNHPSVLNLSFEKDSNGDFVQVESREAFYIFPQCRNSSQWALVPWGNVKFSPHTEKPSDDLQNVHELVQQLKSELPIDEKRIYVTGLSMGGYGTWDYIVRWPEEVAGAIVMCGGADNEGIANNPIASSVPVHIFHGSNDGAVPVIRGRSAFEAVCKKNRNAIYTEYGADGHGIWNRGYSEPKLGEWLFRFKK